MAWLFEYSFVFIFYVYYTDMKFCSRLWLCKGLGEGLPGYAQNAKKKFQQSIGPLALFNISEKGNQFSVCR